ncbi:NDP-hexose 2,3-dehydratase [Lentzea sp. NBRC 105346]|uniref:NDP-hexose 2,3-dehydratase family protein n=1 Tax=Lentzea sp. NBRC 105346 TaxID=3032205 RepID=UPI0024A3FA8F|nr:NDP-hexose 2,3-dehydratase family protein [Lentzea sp. NBRC 105346]GLZ36311.1 NDP-hexose 2,3-dehydratase [Lentzea sp. NBRC 105346]
MTLTTSTRPSRGMLDRFLESASTTDSPAAGSLDDVRAWLATRAAANTFTVDQIDFADLRGWHIDSDTGDIRHDTGGFFRIRGLRVGEADGPVERWSQPIIHQPEVGILGIVVREIDGVLCMLMQAKMEPGNVNMLQLSPTVQATRSNFLRLHGGAPTKFLEYFAVPGKAETLVDVLQSEQGGRFFHKRNRNMIVEVFEDLPVGDEHRWLTLGQVHALLREDNLVNMDTRSVLSCLPLHGAVLTERSEPFSQAVVSSLLARGGMTDVQNWLNHAKSRSTLTAELVPLRGLPSWQQTAREVRHVDGGYFEVIAASVVASNREVRSWTQPLVRPCGMGVVAFLACQVNGTLEVLVQARAEAGTRDVVELGPTVQCIPGNYAHLRPEQRPPYLDLVLGANPSNVRYDVLLSEEGGRFHHAENRYQVIEVSPEVRATPLPPNFRWATLGQLADLIPHSGYLNVEARSLIACTHALC